MKLSTLLISASALLTASIATTATASSPTTQQADGKQDFWDVICHTGRYSSKVTVYDYEWVGVEVTICEDFMGGTATVAKGRR
ncbi:hypothetical protein ACSLBF_18425 (plasmid) [Pseudoalteromonas sp. T1lg65]|uniref:hypothetical protein n=1 Tax=Pseudoalteromonas sp. T1lg65 TaxID=2077101 RepID=UPI003F7A90A9